jgi:hypothetical protein
VPIAEYFLVLLFAVLISVGVVVLTPVSLKYVLAIIPVLMGMVIVPLYPESVYYGLLTIILVFEEYPAEIVESMRWQRTAIYSQSIFIKGIYLLDAILLFLVAYLMIKIFLKEKDLSILKKNKFIVPIIILIFIILLSILVSLMENPNFMQEIYDISKIGFYMTKEAANMISFLQIKVFFYFVVTFLITIFILDSKEKVVRAIYFIMIAAAVHVARGVARFAGRMSEFLNNIAPLFSDTASSFFFSMLIFFLLSMLLFDVIKMNYQRLIALGFILLSALCIVVSFRRTVWAGFLLSAVLYFLVLPKDKKFILFMSLSSLTFILLIALVLSGGLDIIIRAIEGRLQQTSMVDISSLVRYSLYMDMAWRVFTLPPLGYGILPLWNFTLEMPYSLAFNLENIHSLYFWLMLRFGVISLLVFFIFCYRFFKYSYIVFKKSDDGLFKSVGLTFGTSFIVILVSGAAHPIYGETRFMIFLGIMTGILMNVLLINEERAKENEKGLA